jgi:hypothetical protein
MSTMKVQKLLPTTQSTTPEQSIMMQDDYFVRNCHKDNIFEIDHVSTHDLLANMLTKPLPRVRLEKHCLMFGLV